MNRVEDEPKDDGDDDGNTDEDGDAADKTAIDKDGVAAEGSRDATKGTGVAAEGDGVDTGEGSVPAEAANVTAEDADDPAKQVKVNAKKSGAPVKNDKKIESADVAAEKTDDDDGPVEIVPVSGEIEHWPERVRFATPERVDVEDEVEEKDKVDGAVEDAEVKEEPVVVAVPDERRSVLVHWIVYGTFRAFELVARPWMPSFDVIKIVIIFWLCWSGPDAAYKKVVMPVLDEYGPIIDYWLGRYEDTVDNVVATTEAVRLAAAEVTNTLTELGADDAVAGDNGPAETAH